MDILDKDLFIRLLQKEFYNLELEIRDLNGRLGDAYEERQEVWDLRRANETLVGRNEALEASNQRLDHDVGSLMGQIQTLRDQLERTELVKKDPFQLTPGMTMTVFDSIIGKLAVGAKIPAIKYLREQTGIGLREAKDTVDVIEARMKAGTLPTEGGTE